MAPDQKLGLNLLSAPVRELVILASIGRCYWPWLGPNIALDIFIFDSGIMKECAGNGDKKTSYLGRMYGLGLLNLMFLQKNPNLSERREQLETLERCHTLRSWLGEEASADLTEQLELCYFSIVDTREPNPNIWCPGLETHRMRVRARKREFKILKIMVDRIWEETSEGDGRRRIPIKLRRRYNGTGRLIRKGRWHLLLAWERRALLGERTEHHQEHKEYRELIREYRPPHYGVAGPTHYRGPVTVISPFAHSGDGLSPVDRLAELSNYFQDNIYHAPKGLDNFIEIHDFSMLEKPPASVPSWRESFRLARFGTWNN
ncbi:uncharacterized protein PG998_002487 [Apiospora kogelbergensis]|uniref:Uncharacterized protein n=1 Tax=Apiospora kogelbergensis TaxID=1337665 RepID=A0AAW0QGM1_9PEZI